MGRIGKAIPPLIRCPGHAVMGRPFVPILAIRFLRRLVTGNVISIVGYVSFVSGALHEPPETSASRGTCFAYRGLLMLTAR